MGEKSSQYQLEPKWPTAKLILTPPLSLPLEFLQRIPKLSCQGREDAGLPPHHHACRIECKSLQLWIVNPYIQEAPALPHPTTLKAMLQGSKVQRGREEASTCKGKDSKPSRGKSDALHLSFSPQRLESSVHRGRPAHNAVAYPFLLNIWQPSWTASSHGLT